MRSITPLLLAISLTLATTGCFKKNSIKTLPKQVKEIEVQIKEIERHVPSEFLVKCDWLIPLNEGTQSAQLQVTLQNIDNQIECYLRHNSYVDWHLNNQDKE